MSERLRTWQHLQFARARVAEITDDMPLKHVIIRCSALIEAANTYEECERATSHRYEPRAGDDAYQWLLNE